jgi:hypothetical protein
MIVPAAEPGSAHRLTASKSVWRSRTGGVSDPQGPLHQTARDPAAGGTRAHSQDRGAAPPAPGFTPNRLNARDRSVHGLRGAQAPGPRAPVSRLEPDPIRGAASGRPRGTLN